MDHGFGGDNARRFRQFSRAARAASQRLQGNAVALAERFPEIRRVSPRCRRHTPSGQITPASLRAPCYPMNAITPSPASAAQGNRLVASAALDPVTRKLPKP